MDAATAIAALCNAPEAPISEGSCTAVISGGALEPMVKVCDGPYPHSSMFSVQCCILSHSCLSWHYSDSPQLLNDRVSHPMTRAAVLSVLNGVMRKNPSALSETVILGMGALKPLVAMFDHPVIPLINKADAAGRGGGGE